MAPGSRGRMAAIQTLPRFSPPGFGVPQQWIGDPVGQVRSSGRGSRPSSPRLLGGAPVQVGWRPSKTSPRGIRLALAGSRSSHCRPCDSESGDRAPPKRGPCRGSGRVVEAGVRTPGRWGAELPWPRLGRLRRWARAPVPCRCAFAQEGMGSGPDRRQLLFAAPKVEAAVRRDWTV